ncbi:MAG: hypothetical protein WDW38_001376 [Sanguina aurantia]
MPSAYFVFCDQFRAEEKAKLLAEGPEGIKVSVALVAKALGLRWKTLTELEKQGYKEQAAAANAAAEEEKQKQAAEGNLDQPQGDDAQEADAGGSSSDMLPLALLKRIIHCDSDVSRVSHDALVLIAMSAELFLGSLSKRVLPIATRQKRRTIKLEDVEQVIKSDRRLVVAGLKDVVSMVVQLRGEREAAAGTEALQDGHGSPEPEGAEGMGEEEEGQEKDKDKAGEGKQKSKRGRPAGGGSSKGGVVGSKTAKKAKDSTVGVGKIDTFFSKKVQ